MAGLFDALLDGRAYLVGEEGQPVGEADVGEGGEFAVAGSAAVDRRLDGNYGVGPACRVVVHFLVAAEQPARAFVRPVTFEPGRFQSRGGSGWPH